ncbi:hypothetical protein PM082_014770 [Marasmius tenuissimus]|nr:hypothetical protein PM082_014770 [Marasmius tenuissimus]
MRIIGSRAVDEKIRKRQAPAHSKSTRMRVFKDSGEGSNSIAIIREAGGFVYPSILTLERVRRSQKNPCNYINRFQQPFNLCLRN